MRPSAKLKVMTIVGTRPEIIRLSVIIRLLDKFVNHVLVHTGQNYDYELSNIFFEDLDLRKPDYYMDIQNTSVGRAYGEVLIKAEEILLKEKPEAVLILGDTNSSIAGLVAKRLKIPIYHMEAGNRCFDLNVPEEINRKVIDHISDFNLVYTEHARRHLIAEGIHQRRIYLTGSPLYEVLNYYAEKIEKSTILRKLKLEEGKYFLVSIHREENVDYKENFTRIVSTLRSIAETYDYPLIVSTHPRTKKKLEELFGLEIDTRIQFLKPFCFTDYIQLEKHAACTISDSGTISEESSILSFPSITIRQAMERPEAIDAGTIILTGFYDDIVLQSIEINMSEKKSNVPKIIPTDYTVADTSWRVLKLILGTAKLSNIWDNVKAPRLN